jgi:hypothetical protein
MQEFKNLPPTWCEMLPQERHELLGEIIDAMIYSPIAVMNVQSMLKGFKKAGYVKSIIFPENYKPQSNEK